MGLLRGWDPKSKGHTGGPGDAESLCFYELFLTYAICLVAIRIAYSRSQDDR